MSLTIAQQLELLQNIKANIKLALKRAGANITDDTPYSDYAGLIGGGGGRVIENIDFYYPIKDIVPNLTIVENIIVESN